MAANENPTTKFRVDISELKAGIQESNRLIKLANSEFKAAASGMDNWADSTEGLEAKLKQLTAVQTEEEKKLANLQEQYRLTVEAQGENSKGAQELAIKINNQQAAVNKVSTELSTYEDRLELVKKAQANAEKSGNSLEDELRELERALDDAGDAADEAGDEGFTVLKGALADLASNAIQGAISAVGNLISSMMELPEATKEFRTVFGAAMQSAEDSAIGADGAKKAFEEFYKVAADEGQAAEATSHLANLVKNEKDLEKALDGVIGAWVEHSDSISIEGLAEAANETSKTGQITGQFADALNWAAVSEEEFQKKLDGLSTEQERQQLIVQTLNDLYGENAQAYKESNSSILSANEANLKLLESQSEMATVIEPLTASWTNLKANALEAITPVVVSLVEKFTSLVNYLKENELAAQILTGVVIALATGFGVLAAAFAITNIINAVSKAMALLNTTMLANPFVLIVALIAGLVAAFLYLRKNGDEVKAFFAKMWQAMKTAASNAIDAIIGFFKGMPAKMWQWFLVAIQKVADLRTQLIAKGKAAAQGLWDAIVNKIKGLPSEIRSIGSDIVKGLWNGINDMTGWVIGKIQGFGESVLGGIKDFFGVESPSKVMRDEVGKFLAQGIGVGFENEMAPTIQGMKSSLAGAVGIAKGGLQSAGVSGGIAGNTYNFYQTNNSPKSLSRIEIYRQTKNQFRLLQEV